MTGTHIPSVILTNKRIPLIIEMKNRIYILATFLSFINGIAVYAQEVNDTLNASVIRSEKIVRSVGRTIVKAENFRNKVSAMGESDYIKAVQSMPGVSGGADGTSAYYVRGGDIGGNLITLDGTPIYGASHLLGLTAVVPNDLISSMDFQVGGFSGNEGNLTSSHIRLNSNAGDFSRWGGNWNLSNFMTGASIGGPVIKNRLSFTAGGRWSPLRYEYSLFDKYLENISGFTSTIYDWYAKLDATLPGGHNLSAGLFRSLDEYDFAYNSVQDGMAWENRIGNFSWNWTVSESFAIETAFYANAFSSSQQQVKIFNNVENAFGIKNELEEYAGKISAKKKLNFGLDIEAGFKARYATFNPGSSVRYEGKTYREGYEYPVQDNIFNNMLYSIFLQADYDKEGPVKVSLSLRHSIDKGEKESTNESYSYARPDLSASVTWKRDEHSGVEFTYDNLVQFYHTLEGLPVGWALDLLVPSTAEIAPQTAQQFYLGAYLDDRHNAFTLGGYFKQMNGILYFANAQSLFTASLTDWESTVYSGEGRSYGLEFTYAGHYFDDRLTANLSYTLSKTDRQFDELNLGKRFPAKFDRRHILNTSLDYKIIRKEKRTFGLTSSISLQSGNWETVAESHYSYTLLDGDQAVDVDFYGGVNNYELPNYFRWDAGLYFNIKGKYCRQTVNLGVYNLTNRHNPFMLTYSPDTGEWRKVSLIPIMPSFSYRIEF